MANVTKKDLVENISEKTGLTQVDTKIVVESFLEAVSQALQGGRNIEIRGFGRFKIKEKKARMARNPRTNENIKVDSGYKPVFEASKELRKRINDRFIEEIVPSAAEAVTSSIETGRTHSEPSFMGGKGFVPPGAEPMSPPPQPSLGV